MESYRDEIRTPPLALVALLGRPDLQPVLSDFLLKEHRPPLAAIGAAELSSASQWFGEKPDRRAEALPSAQGMIKCNWLAKHRKRRPAVAVAFFDIESLSDPTSYANVCYQIDTIRTSTKARGAKLVIVVVQPGPNSPALSEERANTLRRRAEVDSRSVLTYDSWDPTSSMQRLGKLLYELAIQFYHEEGNRIKAKLSQRGGASMELAVRYCFKIGAYAEFRQDWASALKYYGEAYKCLQEVPRGKEPYQLQRLAEIVLVSEQINFKLCTLLLHSGSLEEAVSQFRQHMLLWKHVLPAGAPAIILAAHASWRSRQYLTFAEQLEARAPPTAPASHVRREHMAGFYFHAAATSMIECRTRYDQARATSHTTEDSANVPLIPGEFVGQWVHPGKSGGPTEPTELVISDSEWAAHRMAEERGIEHARLATELLTRAHDQFKQQSSSSTAAARNRLYAHLIAQMAGEYMQLLDYSNARRLLVSMASVYRREGWEQLLCSALQSLRECARRLDLPREHAEHSLELAALRLSVDDEQRMALFTSALAVLTEPQPATGSAVEPSTPAQEGRGSRESYTDLGFLINDTSSLRTVFLCAVGFHEPTVTCGSTATLTVAMQARLPLSLPIWKLEIHFKDEQYNTFLGRVSWDDGCEVEPPALVLSPNKWQYSSFSIVPTTATDKLECMAVVARVGPAAFFKWDLGRTLVHKPPPLASLTPGMCDRGAWAVKWLENSPCRTLSVVDSLPSATLHIKCSASVFVGEHLPVEVTIESTATDIPASQLQLKMQSQTDPQAQVDKTAEGGDISNNATIYWSGDDRADTTDTNFPLRIVPDAVQLPHIPAGTSHKVKLLVRFKKPAQAVFHASLLFTHARSANPEEEILIAQQQAEVSCEFPFVLEHHYSTRFRHHSLSAVAATAAASAASTPLPVISTRDNVVLAVCVRSTSNVPLQVQPLQLEVCEGAPFREIWSSTMDGLARAEGDDTKPSQGDSFRTLHPGGAIVDLFELVPYPSDNDLKRNLVCAADNTPGSLGAVQVRWIREQPQATSRGPDLQDSLVGEGSDEAGNNDWVLQQMPLPEVIFSAPPLTVQSKCPEQGILGVPITLTITLQNHTVCLQTVHVSVVDAPGFVLAGERSGAVAVLPSDRAVINYSLVAIDTGVQSLPGLHLTVSHSAKILTLPDYSRQVYIYPAPCGGSLH